MRYVLPDVILDDIWPRRHLSHFSGSKAANPVRIRKILKNRLVDGGGNAVVFLFRRFVHRLPHIMATNPDYEQGFGCRFVSEDLAACASASGQKPI